MISIPMETEGLVVEATNAGFRMPPVILHDMRPDEILVEMRYTGICHTDVVGSTGGYDYILEHPSALGHEGAGVILATGSDVTDVSLQVGRSVILSFNYCGACQNCATNHPASCTSFEYLNIGARRQGDKSTTARLLDGRRVASQFFGQSSFLRHSIVSQHSVVPCPYPEDLALYAALGCGFQTGAGTVLNTLKPARDDSIVVFGAGAVGVAAIMAAKCLGVRQIIAVDIQESKLELAKELGATDVIHSLKITPSSTGSGIVEEILKRTRNNAGVRFAIECTGVATLMEEMLDCVCSAGCAVVIGVPKPDFVLKVNPMKLLHGNKSLRGLCQGDSVSKQQDALDTSETIGYPIMLKATGGGDGMGLKICHSSADVTQAFRTVQESGERLFKNAGVLLEKYYPRSRHVEVQVFGNGTDVVHFAERECSVQRRHQKVIEKCPSPFVERHPGLRKTLTSCATTYAAALSYKSAGTVENLVDDDSADFFFLEMNTRLQVEHGITEMCYNVDLVALMLRQADCERAGLQGLPSAEPLSMQKSEPDGVAMEARIYPEDPHRAFAPSPGVFQEVRWPDRKVARIDTWIQAGQQISLHYDPLLAKAMVHAGTRVEALDQMTELCSGGIVLRDPATNLDFIRAIIVSKMFQNGNALTNFIDTEFTYHPRGIDVISGGPYSTIQDLAGRPTMGHGVPKNGPMDRVSAQVANLLVHNPADVEVIEATLHGPTLFFTYQAVVSVCGAECSVTIDDQARLMWTTLLVDAGQTLRVGPATGAGCRIYIAVRGGFGNVPQVLGSRSTTPSLKYGGYQGRTLRSGDFLQLSADWEDFHEFTLPPSMIPDITVRDVYVLQGPHDSDDIMTAEDREMLYGTEWKLGHNSDRTGLRMIGPSPQWARSTGGDAGSHASSYLDYGYPSPGGVNWGGDSACILSVDSPNFGGRVCSSTVISADLWELGQLRPGDGFRLVPVSLEDAVEQIRRVDRYISSVKDAIETKGTTSGQTLSTLLSQASPKPDAAILKFLEAGHEDTLRPRVTYRQAGDRFLLVELGKQRTNIGILARLKLLLEELRNEDSQLLLTPHISSLMIEYDPIKVSQRDLLARVYQIESQIEATLDLRIPCRQLQIPLVMDHPAIQECMQRYMETTRDKAAYLPDNLDYLRKSNSLKSRREVFDMMTSTDFVVPAVGFICGTPVFYPLTATPLTCQKYNPTRVSTPAGTIGFGGSILSGYSIESPGGYMIAGRTLEMWDTFGVKPGFSSEKPWLFEPFDKVRFFEVSVDEYDGLAREFEAGRYVWDVSRSDFNVREAYETVHLRSDDPDVVEFKKREEKGRREQEALERDLYAQWKASSQGGSDGNVAVGVRGQQSLPYDAQDCVVITSPMVANLWKLESSVTC